MKQFILIITALVLFLNSDASAQTKLEWVKQVSGNSNYGANCLAVDNSGSTITIGEFFGDMDFDPGPEVFNLSSGNGNIYILKLDAEGNFLWAKQLEIRFADPMVQTVSQIVTDNSDNIYFIGTYTDTVDFDPGPEVFSMIADVSRNLFIVKLRPSGEFAWAKQFEGKRLGSLSAINSIATTGDFIYTTGFIRGTFDFDPRQSEFLIESPGANVDPIAFVSKLDSNGNFIWAKHFTGIHDTFGKYISVNDNGDVYTTGQFWKTIEFISENDSVKLLSNGSSIYIAKLNSDGNFQWALQLPGIDRSMKIDQDDNVIISGEFDKTTDFDPGQGIFTLSPSGADFNRNVFILKLNSKGEFVWAKKIGSDNQSFSNATTIDIAGNIYTTGVFSGTADFDPGVEAHIVTADVMEFFLVKLNSFGNFLWVNTFNTMDEYYQSYSTVIDETGNIYTRGNFKGTADFDPEGSVYNMTSKSAIGDIFIQKLSQKTTGITENPFKELTSAPFPNPSTGKILIENPFKNTKKAISIAVYTIEGELLKEYTSISEDKLQIDLSKEKSGVYAIKLASGTEVYVAKVTIIQ